MTKADREHQGWVAGTLHSLRSRTRITRNSTAEDGVRSQMTREKEAAAAKREAFGRSDSRMSEAQEALREDTLSHEDPAAKDSAWDGVERRSEERRHPVYTFQTLRGPAQISFTGDIEKAIQKAEKLFRVAKPDNEEDPPDVLGPAFAWAALMLPSGELLEPDPDGDGWHRDAFLSAASYTDNIIRSFIFTED
jgi:hypothetical protein